MAIYGYVFISQEEGSGVDTEHQKNAISRYAQKKLGDEVNEYFIEEGTSIKRALRERPVGSKMLSRTAPGDSIVVMQIEWILGSASEASRLMSRARREGVGIHCLDLGANVSLDEKRRLAVTEGNAVLIGKLLKAMAICESSRHGDAIRAAKKTRKDEGRYLGGPVPFGWQVSRKGFLEENGEQQKIIARIRKLRDQRWSYREISKTLRSEHEVKLSHEGVRRILISNDKKKGSVDSS